MKRIYIQFLLILLVSTFNIDLQAQRLNIPEKSTIGDEFLIAPDGTYSELRPDLSGNCGCEISDLSFNWSGSFEAAIANENLIRLARKRTLKKWYTNQINKVVKPAIEYKLNLKFPSYSEAKTALFKYSERGNISRNLPITKRNLEKKVSVNQSRQQKYLKDLKILNIREAEISSGNITSSEFGYYKVNGIDLRNIKTISDLNKTKKTINSQFESNHIELFKNNLIYKKAKSLNYWSIEKEVISKKHNYYNSFNEWDRLNLMQLLVHYEQYKQLSNCMVCLQPESFTKFKGLDIGTTEFITAYATKNKGGGMSVFHKDYWREILYKEYKEKTIYKYNPSLFMQHFIVLTNAAQKEHKKRKKEELNKLLNSTSTADFAITNFIEELKITNTKQKEWLYKHKSEANKLVRFANDNRYRGFVNSYAKKFVNNAIEAYMKNIDVIFEQTKVTEVINNIQNPITGNPVELYLIAKHKRNILLYLSSYSTSREIKVGDYYLKPHYDKAKKLVFYTAYRTDSSGRSLFGIEMLIKASGLKDFKENISLYTSGANLFYLQGVPSEGQIALAAGDYWSGLGQMWKDAIKSEEWWAYAITTMGHFTITNSIRKFDTSVKYTSSSSSYLSKSRLGKMIGTLRETFKKTGNFGMGPATRAEAEIMGKAWLGKGFRESNRTSGVFISADGLRQYRSPSFKPSLNKTQANFQSRYKPTGNWVNNGHLDIID
ncbi:hypothetical protein TOREUM_30182 [Tenacibaculum litoreum]|uniref:hypothetical protein n=1 Tax=Tenacibaculum litoreum TaxID=321269 RepID=UPI0038946C25